jgi:pimeloyl-ACP methyl ester carboxylesterase
VPRTANGLFYDDIGSSADVLLWGHGFLASAATFAPVIDLLPEFRHIAIDHRGFAHSAAITEQTTLARMADDLSSLIDELHLEPVTYVGHSMGGAVGVRLMAARPDKLRSVISIAGVPVSGMPDDEATTGLLTGVASLQGNRDGLFQAFTGMLAHPLRPGVLDQLADDAAKVQPGPIQHVASTELQLDEANELFPGPELPRLFIIPGRDVCIAPDAQFAAARRYTNAEIVWLTDEGHLVPQERPILIAEHIRAFLKTTLNVVATSGNA